MHAHPAVLSAVLSSTIFAAALSAQAGDLPRRGMLGARIDTNAQGQVVVREVLPNSAAQAMQLAPGARIIAINGSSVTSVPMFLQSLGKLRAGNDLALTVEQDGQASTRTVSLPALPHETHANARVTYGTARSPGGTRLRTILVAPTQRRAAVILYVQGIGCGTLDRPLAPESDPEMRLMRDLLGVGYATLRVDRTGTGDSEGIPCSEAGFDAELDAARAALAWVRQRPDVDPSRIILLGFSMGGVVAPLLAGEQGVTDVVVWGTLSRNFLEYQIRNIRRQLPREGLRTEDAESTMVARIEALSRLMFLRETPAQVRSQPGLADALPVSDSTHMFGRHARYFQQLQRIDSPGSWARVRQRTLALHGEYDWVSDPEDHQLIAEIVNRNGGTAEYHEVPGLDHAMTLHPSLEASQQNYLQGAPSTAAVDRIAAWLGRQDHSTAGNGAQRQ